MKKLHIEGHQEGDMFTCSLLVAEDEDAYRAHEVTNLSEVHRAKTQKEAFVAARTEAINTLNAWITAIALYEISSEE